MCRCNFSQSFLAILIPFALSSTSSPRLLISLKQFWYLLPEREISYTSTKQAIFELTVSQYTLRSSLIIRSPREISQRISAKRWECDTWSNYLAIEPHSISIKGGTNSDGGESAEMVRIKRDANAVIDWENPNLISLSPVFDHGDIRRRLRRHH